MFNSPARRYLRRVSMWRFCILASFGLFCASRADAQELKERGPVLLLAPDSSLEFAVEAMSADSTIVGAGCQSGPTKLEPGKAYRFGKFAPVDGCSDSIHSQGKSFAAPQIDNTTFPFRVLVAGDNRSQHISHRAVVRAIEKRDPYHLYLHTGDMVARGGSENDWNVFFYLENALLIKQPVVAALGNHELYGDESGERYLRYFGGTISPGKERAYFARRLGPVDLWVLDSNEDWSAPDSMKQMAWLKQRVADRAENRSRFLFVVVHQSPISSGRHGSHLGMRAAGVLDLFRAAGVDLIFAGHDHDYERGTHEGINYVVTGGGGAPLYDSNSKLEGQGMFLPIHHFTELELQSPTSLALRAIDTAGTVFDDCSLQRREPLVCSKRPAPMKLARVQKSSVNGFPSWGYWLVAGVGVLSLLLWRRKSI